MLKLRVGPNRLLPYTFVCVPKSGGNYLIFFEGDFEEFETKEARGGGAYAQCVSESALAMKLPRGVRALHWPHWNFASAVSGMGSI